MPARYPIVEAITGLLFAGAGWHFGSQPVVLLWCSVLAALVALCRSAGVVQIDCQQATQHLASLGAAEMPRDDFLQVAQAQQTYPAMHWQFSPHLWATLGLPTYD